jgi:hypothetical protein
VQQVEPWVARRPRRLEAEVVAEVHLERPALLDQALVEAAAEGPVEHLNLALEEQVEAALAEHLECLKLASLVCQEIWCYP